MGDREDVAGKRSLIRFEEKRCIHSRQCVLASKNKPYCDSSHVALGFVATGEPATQTSASLATRAGKLNVTPRKNGPLLVDGNLEVVSGTGRTINRVTKTALCRCGKSANRPYCDGTHAKVGFISE